MYPPDSPRGAAASDAAHIRKAGHIYLGYKAAHGFSQFVAISAFSLYLLMDVGVSPLEFVLTGTVLEIAITLSEVPTGVIADTVSRRLSIAIGLFVMGVGFALIAVPVYGVILASQVVWGVGFTFTSGADVAWITDEVGEERARPLYLRAAQLRFAAVLAGLGAGAALGTIALWIPIVAAAVLHLLLGVVVLTVMPERGFVGPGLGAAGDRNPFRTMGDTVRDARRIVRRSRVLMLILAVTLVVGFGSEGIDRLWQLHFIDDLDMPAGEPILWITGVWGIGLLVGAVVVEVIRRRATLATSAEARRAYLVVMCVVLGGVLALAVAPWFAVGALAVVAVAAAREVGQPVMAAWVNQGLDPRTRATVNSVASQAHAVGELTGGPVFGVIAQWVSVPWALTATALSHTPAVLLLARRPRRVADNRAPVVLAPTD